MEQKYSNSRNRDDDATSLKKIWPSVRWQLGITELITECASAGESHSVVVLSDGTAKAFGDTRHGQCGLPARQSKKVRQVSAGGKHTIVVLEDGTAKAFGDDRYGQCNIPALQGKKVMKASAGGKHSLIVLEDGTARAFGENEDGQCRIPNLQGKKVVQASAGKCHSILVLEDGTAKAFGNKWYGRCWIPDLQGKAIVQASAGVDHSVLVFEDGTAKAFGDNRHGQCAIPALEGKKAVQASAGGKHTLLVLEDGTARAFGDNGEGQCNIPDLTGKKVMHAAAGDKHSVLMLEDGSAKAFGHNSDGQCVIPALKGKKVVPASALIVRSLCADEASLRRATAAALASMPLEYQIVSAFVLNRLLAKERERRQAATHVVVEHSTIFMQATDEYGNSPLHLAASEGDVQMCKILVTCGALLVARNSSRQTPLDVAWSKRHRSSSHHMLVDYLESQRTIGGARGGSGNAWPAAADDERPVQGIDWFVLPLEGWAGRAGIVHSLLRIIVTGDGSQSMYVLEKAALPEDLPEHDVQRLNNGVYVSFWRDVAPNIESVSIRSLKPGDIAKSHQTIGSLRELLIDMGTYDVGLRNCHHAALVAYNACAKQKLDDSAMPNNNFVAAAGLLRSLGFEGSVLSASAASGAASVSSTAGAVGDPADAVISRGGGFASVASGTGPLEVRSSSRLSDSSDQIPSDRPENTSVPPGGEDDRDDKRNGNASTDGDIDKDHAAKCDTGRKHGDDEPISHVKMAMMQLSSVTGSIATLYNDDKDVTKGIECLNEQLRCIELWCKEVESQQLQRSDDSKNVVRVMEEASSSLQVQPLDSLQSDSLAMRLDEVTRTLQDVVGHILKGTSLPMTPQAVQVELKGVELAPAWDGDSAEQVNDQVVEAKVKKPPSCCAIS